MMQETMRMRSNMMISRRRFFPLAGGVPAAAPSRGRRGEPKDFP
jgi:hypothetical protein